MHFFTAILQRQFTCTSHQDLLIQLIMIMFAFCKSLFMTLSSPLELGFNDFLAMLFEPASITTKLTRLFSSFTRGQTYVDDIILTAYSTSLLQRIISLLHAEFAMIDLGPLNYFLGISVMRNTSGIFLSQTKYATEILEQAQMLNCNPCKTPTDTEKKLRPEGSSVIDPTLYRSLAGSLQYLTFTRPDLSYAVQQLCLYMHDPQEPHLNAMKRFPATRRSTSGYCVFLGDNLLTWSSKRQDTLSCSSSEAEYRGVANVVAETSWIRNLLLQHQRTKHIEIDIYFVRDKVAAGHVRVLHVPSRFRYANIFTKDSSLWSRVISAIHGNSGHLHKLPTTSSSSTWMNIIREMFNLKHQGIDLITYITEKVGKEDSLFWDGVWTGDTTLKEQYPRVHALETCKSISVANKLAHSNVKVSLRRPPRGGVELHQYNSLSSRLDSIRLPMIKDRWVLSLDGTWEFTTASARKLIDDKRLPKVSYNTRWIKPIPIKLMYTHGELD
nr:ribonuclease H-like domain-containing protein [Tanacetum cinerariifolium]